jgi:Ca2+-binding RTX toxin-like protein
MAPIAATSCAARGAAFIGGAADDVFRGKGGSDTLTGGGGADTFIYVKKDTAGGAVDTITDFAAGTDVLDLSDFLKGHESYDQVLRVHAAADGSGTIVEGLVKGTFVDVVVLEGVTTSTLADLGIV